MKIKHILIVAFIVYCQASLAQKFSFSQANKLTVSVNSESEESLPILTPDGKTLYFSRSFYKDNIGGTEGGQDIWKSSFNDSDWSAASAVEQFNTKGNEAVVGMSRDGNRIYLLNAYNDKKNTKPGLSVSEYNNGKWTKPKALIIPDFDVTGDFYGFYMHPDEQVLFISMDGDGTYGKEDLYYSVKDSSGNWQAPVHLDNHVNSEGFEIAPFLSDDGKTLYFSSDGFKGMGSCDIYLSHRLDDSWDHWSEPVNLGKEINTSGFDAYFVISADNRAYYTSNRGDDDRYSDIYSSVKHDFFELALLDDQQLNLIESKSEDVKTFRFAKLPPQESYEFNFVTPVDDDVEQINIIFNDDDGNEVNAVATRNKSGKFTYLPPKKELTPPAPPVSTVPDEMIVYFDLNSSVIRSDAKGQLDEVYQTLSKDATLTIEITAHTDLRAEKSYNQWLSDRRASGVKNYLVQKGISAVRMQAIGMGESHPVINCEDCPEEDQQKNRRAQITFVSH